MTASTMMVPTGSAHDRQQRTTTAVAAALDGDPLALRVVMAGVRPAVARYCRARLGVGHRASAVTADVCSAVERELHSRPRSGLQIHAFVHAVVRTAVDLAEPDVAGLASGSGMPATLLQLAQLEREVLVLRVAVGLTVDETAAALDSSPAAVRLAQHRALDRLRELRDR